MLFPLFDHNPTKRFPLFTILLIVANVVVFVQCQRLGAERQRELYVERGFVPKRFTHLNENKPIDIVLRAGEQEFRGKLDVDPPAVYASIFTMMFLHGGWLHLLANMWMLWVFGNNIEDRLGSFVFIGFYLLGGVIAVFAHWLSAPEAMTPVIGASGAVWAVLGGYAITYPTAKVKTLVFVVIPLLLELPALLVIAFWCGMDLLMAVAGLDAPLRGAAVAHWAHIGGCAAGVLLTPLLSLGAQPADSDWRGETDELLVQGARSE